MTQDAPATQPPPPPGRPRQFWLTVGEVVAVAGLLLAGLNYWENHRDREQSAVEAQAEAKARAQAASVFVLRGAADADGARVMLEPVKAEQVIQTQRYVFPSPVLDHPMEIGAGKPQIDLKWFEKGLRRQLKAARKDGAPLPKGEAELPVGVATTYIEGGEQRTDRSLYRIGYVADGGFLGAVHIHLLGAALIRRGAGPDLQAEVDARWRTAAPAPPKPPAAPKP